MRKTGAVASWRGGVRGAKLAAKPKLLGLAALCLLVLGTESSAQPEPETGLSPGAVFRVGYGGTASLAGPWKFRPSDDPSWASPELDDSDWRSVWIPTGFGRDDATAEIAWYRVHVQIGPEGRVLSLAERAALGLGVAIGKVDSAYEIYAGGSPLGGAGAFPPSPRLDYDRHRIYPIPPAAIDASGRLVLALRVWKSPQTRGGVGGPHEGPFRIGALVDLVRLELTSELPALMLAILFLVTGLFHLELYRRRPVQLGYLWFAATSIFFAGYSFLRTQWRYAWIDDFLLLKEVEYFLIFTVVALFIELVWGLLGVRIRPALRIYQWACVAVGTLIALTPGVFLNVRALPFWQLSLALPVAWGLWVIFREAWDRNPEARIIAFGAIVATTFFVNDVLVDRGFVTGPRLIPFGFAVFVLSLAMSLANQFRRTHEELETLRHELETRVEERTRELVEANRSKSHFLARMSHEIRTPIHGVMGMAELLADSGLPAAQQQQIEVIGSSADKLRRLVDDLLDFSSLDAGKMALEKTDFALRREVRQVVELSRPRAAAKGLELHLEVSPELPDDLNGDPSRLCQALFNLIDNAIKFTRKGSILVRAMLDARDEARLCFEVRDSGIGIAGEDHDRLFQPFTQLDESTRREFGGTGLGLAITRGLVDLMGGELGVENEPSGGSCFWLWVPLCLAGHAAEAPKDPSRPAAGTELTMSGGTEPGPATSDERSDALDDTATLLDRPKERRVAVDPQAPRVLVVDDLATNRQMTVLALHSLGFRADAVAGGREALDAVAGTEYQLVLMDCRMPDVDGYETTRRLRRFEGERGSRRLPVVAFTIHGGELEREKCLAAGMDDYLAKPFYSDELAAVLQRWVPAAGSSGEAPAPGKAVGGMTSDSNGVSPRESGAGFLDPAILANLRQLRRTSAEELLDAVATYREEGSANLARMRQALREEDPAALAEAAHQLAGSSGFVGASILSMLCRELQDLARSGGLPDGASRVAQIEAGYRQSVAGLEKALGASPGAGLTRDLPGRGGSQSRSRRDWN